MSERAAHDFKFNRNIRQFEKKFSCHFPFFSQGRKIFGKRMKRFQVVMFGSGGVGKTALVNSFLWGEFPQNYVATIEDRFNKFVDIDGTTVQLDILDTAGTVSMVFVIFFSFSLFLPCIYLFLFSLSLLSLLSLISEGLLKNFIIFLLRNNSQL